MVKGARIDLTGRRVGRLTVLRPARRDAHGPTAWHCRCACGARVVIAHGLLVGRGARSCGCRKRGVPRGRHERRDRAIAAAWRAGQSCAALAERFGLTSQRVGAIVRAAGGDPGASRYPGGTAQRDRDILDARQRGETLAAIGARFGLTGERVRQIVRGAEG